MKRQKDKSKPRMGTSAASNAANHDASTTAPPDMPGAHRLGKTGRRVYASLAAGLPNASFADLLTFVQIGQVAEEIEILQFELDDAPLTYTNKRSGTVNADPRIGQLDALRGRYAALMRLSGARLKDGARAYSPLTAPALSVVEGKPADVISFEEMKKW